jgi:ornithine--oxo-acid transaminase
MMNSIFRRVSTHNMKRIFNFNIRQFSNLNNEYNFDLFGAKKISAVVKASGAGNKVANVSKQKIPSIKSKPQKILEPVEEVKSNRKKSVPVKKELEEVDVKQIRKSQSAKKSIPIVPQKNQKVEAAKKKLPAGRKKPIEEPEEEFEEEIVATPTKITKKTPLKAVNAKKTPVSAKKQPIKQVEEELEEVETTPAKFSKKTPKKAAHTVHTLQTQPVSKKEPVQSVKVTAETESIASQSKGKKKKSEAEVAPKKVRPSIKKSENADWPESIVVDLNNPHSLGKVPLDTPLDHKKYTSNPKGRYVDYVETKITENTKQAIMREKNYLCNNYEPLPVICQKGEGVYLQDIDGKIYMDFLSAYSAANQGHCHKKIIDSAIKQMKQLHITSRAFYNNILATAGEYICKVFNFEKILFMNSGAEGCESAIKIARRWGYEGKKIPEDQAKMVYAKGNFMGRTIHVCGLSDDPYRYKNFGPFDKSSHYLVEYDNLEAIREVLEKDPNICGVFLEPIQGENGIIIPSPGYLKGVAELCKEKNVLFIDDEIQTGCGRTGFPIYCDSEGVHPDMLILGKSLSGGLYPVSAVLCSKEVMDHIKPGEHGSTYGGNPLAANIALSAIHELLEGGMIQNSFTRGIEFGLCLKELENNNIIKEIRGRGLMYGIELWPECGFNAYDISLWLMERGLLCKPSKTHTLR